MVGARLRETSHGNRPHAGHHGVAETLHSCDVTSSSALAAAPEGLSARRVEDWLHLPAGAWQKRHLYALRIKSEGFAALGLGKGDLVVVEPGGKQQAGSLVVTRGEKGASLRRVPSFRATHRRMPTVLELPLRERATGEAEHVVGTVIGHLRPTGTGALRPVPMRAYGHGKRRQPPRPSTGTATVMERHELPAELLERTRAKWTAWLSAARQSAIFGSADEERWDRLDASFLALCDCLSRTHNFELRSALAEEAETILTAIRTEMGRYCNYPFLQ